MRPRPEAPSRRLPLRADPDDRSELIARERLARREAQEARERMAQLSRRLVEVQEAERRRIARELHDEIGQILTGLRIMLEMDGRNGSDRHAEMRGLVDDLVRRVREMSLDLRPSVLDDLGLLPALLSLVERFGARAGLRVDFHHSGVKRRFASEVETAAYRIVQEALTNVARHAHVHEVEVELRCEGDRLHVDVSDRGVGFDPVARRGRPASMGLTSMQERAQLLGGTLTVDSAPGEGTRIHAEIPALESTETGWREYLT